MNKKVLITILITLLSGGLLFLSTFEKKIEENINTLYRVYLNGKTIGVIADADALYDLINQSQVDIKNNYGVDTVYPPTNLKIIPVNTYDNTTNSINDVYNEVEKNDDFTIKGYSIEVKGEDHNYELKVLDKEIFYNAAKKFVQAFLNENDYENYINNTQEEILETGKIIEKMRFLEAISIKEAYISVKDKIYTDETELSQFLLFGENPTNKSYTVKLGDTIKSVSDANKLNVQEFLMANTKFKSESSLLRVGEKVNVTLISPQLTFIYDLYEIKNEITFFDKVIVKDPNKYTSFREVTTPGINGIDRVKETYSVTNGVRSQTANVTILATVRDVQNQVTTIGTKRENIYIPPNPVNLDGYWGWPTNRGYVITSEYEWRWGSFHSGLDISGAGNFGSQIYAVSDGVVTYAYNGCPSSGYGIKDHCGNGLGNQIRIDHQNGYVTRYGHLMNKVNVKAGQTVKKGDVIGYMGNSGSSTGPHVHYEVIYNGKTINPRDLYR